jgi:penicillin-binding protein 1A
MGIRSKLPVFPSLALGACEVSPWEMTAAYGTFANQGIALEPIFITRIEDRYGNVIYEQKPGRNAENALEPSLANAMTTMMKQVVQSGTATRIKQFYPYDAAGKTGTTNDFTDAWFAGYTPSLTSAIWIGFDDIRVKFTGDYGQGGRAVAPLWGRIMGAIYTDTLLPYRRTPRFKEENTTPDSTIFEENLNIIPSEVENPVMDSITEPPEIPPPPATTNRPTRLPSLRRDTSNNRFQH